MSSIAIAKRLNQRTLAALVSSSCAIALLLSACGGGGSSSSPSSGGSNGPAAPVPVVPVVTGVSPAPSAGPGDSTLLFPTAQGSSWKYDVQQTQTGKADLSGIASISVDGTTLVSGAMTTKFTISNSLLGSTSFDQFYTSSGGGVTFYGNDDPTDLITNQLTPSAGLKFPVVNGQEVSNIAATGIPAGTSSAGHAITANLTQRVSVGGIESVTVSAGIFSNAVKVVTTVAGTLTDAIAAQSIPINSTDTSWYAPGVGLVQEIQTSTSGATTQTQSFSARGYTIGGIQHGLSAPITLVNDTYPSASPSQFARGLENSLVRTQSSTSSTAIGQLISNDGTLQASVPLAGFEIPKLAFNGTNYVSVSYDRNPADNANFDLTLQRISPAGIVLDPSPGKFISGFANIQGAVPFAAGGANGQTLVVFSKFEPLASNDHQHLFAMSVDSNGNASSATGLPVAETSKPLNGTIAFDGTNYLLVWQADAIAGASNTFIYAVRITPGGVALDATPMLLSSGTRRTTEPAVAFDGANYLVVWADSDGLPQTASNFNTVWGRRVSPSGALLDGPTNAGALQISSNPSRFRSNPVVAFSGTEYMVGWFDSDTSITVVKAARVSPSGGLSSGVGFELQLSDRSAGVAGILTALSKPLPQFLWFGFSAGHFTLAGVVAHPF